MFSALKKLTSKNDSSNVLPQTAGSSMPNSLQKKFAKGCNFNMKVIIKGDRNVGKSCLLERLQGKSFIEAYTPTDQIQVQNIHWTFKNTEDIVKVEVWDVVDRGKSRPKVSGSLKLSSAKEQGEQPILDAEFLDVYKGTHGVILMLDITKNWTFEYILKELPKISPEIPVLILANHCDMNHHRTISNGQVQALIEENENRAAQVIYGESSMRNGFGLRLVHKFLGLPFLRLQRISLLESLERNARDSNICSFEISEFLKSDESNYSQFLDNLVHKRRAVADSNPKMLTPNRPLSFTPSPTSVSSQNFNVSPASATVNYPDYLKPTKSIILGGGQPIIVPGTNKPAPATTTSGADKSLYNKSANSSSASISTTNSNDRPKEADHKPDKQQPTALSKSSSIDCKIDSVDEFCPEGGSGLDRTFLEDAASAFESVAGAVGPGDSDSDNENGGNPLVATFEEDTLENFAYESTQEITRKLDETKLTYNPLSKKKHESSSRRKLSLSSIEIDVVTKSDLENVETASGMESQDSWIDTKLRRSPEGGEDDTSTQVVIQELATSLNEDEEDENPLKKPKKKKTSKEKKDKSEKSVSKEKKKKKKSRDNESSSTAEFFGESSHSSIQQIDECYENYESYEAL